MAWGKTRDGMLVLPKAGLTAGQDCPACIKAGRDGQLAPVESITGRQIILACDNSECGIVFCGRCSRQATKFVHAHLCTQCS